MKDDRSSQVKYYFVDLSGVEVGPFDSLIALGEAIREYFENCL
jgi:hypothetical protein